MLRRFYFLFIVLLFCFPVWAGDKADQAAHLWTGSLQFGGVMNTGNTSNENVNTKMTLNFKTDTWQNMAAVSAFISENRGSLDGTRYNFEGESHYFFNPERFAFANTHTTWDRFSPYDYMVTVAGGYGFRLFERAHFFWGAQFGPGWRGSQQSETKRFESVIILQPSMRLEWTISPTVHFEQVFSADIAKLSNYYSTFRSETTLETHIIGNLGLQLSYRMTYNSSIPEESDNSLRLDTVTQVSAIYKF